jgi:integrase
MRRPTSVPSYRRHKQSGKAVVTLRDALGSRRDVLLGKYGSAASRAEYARVIAEWETNGRRLPQPVSRTPTDITVNELAVAYLQHAKQHYRYPDGTQTNEYDDSKYSLRPLLHLYGPSLARDFGPLALKAVRELMVQGYEHPKYGTQAALSRGVVNQRTGRVRRLFRWAVENEMVPATVLHGLQAVKGLSKGRSAARETEPVKPVPEVFLEAVLPYLRPQVSAMVQLQLLTGMRPGELVVMRACDIDMTGKVWLYRPGRHKTAWRGHNRVIAIGPRGQEIIREFLKPNVERYLFAPWEAVAALRREQRARRKSRVQPSQQVRRKAKPRRTPGERYTTGSYAVAIGRACQKADAAARQQAIEAGMAPDEAAACVFVPHWHPHQLRHSAATTLRREFGLDVARVVLGHRSPQITELYAELDLSRAVEVMEKLG